MGSLGEKDKRKEAKDKGYRLLDAGYHGKGQSRTQIWLTSISLQKSANIWEEGKVSDCLE